MYTGHTSLTAPVLILMCGHIYDISQTYITVVQRLTLGGNIHSGIHTCILGCVRALCTT